MDKAKFNQYKQDIMEQGKEAVAEGNQRHIALIKQDGTQLFETSLTIAASVGLFALLTGFLTFPVIIIAGIAAYATKIKVEMRRDNIVNLEA